MYTFGQPPPPTRHVIVEKTLDKTVATDKYILAPGGCIWIVHLQQCLITQFIYRGEAPGYVYYSRIDNHKAIPLKSEILRKILDTDESFYLEYGQDVVAYSDFKMAARYLYSFVIPERINILTNRLLSKNIRADKKVKARIMLIGLRKRLRRMKSKLKNDNL